jgi:hypothetical protein
MSPISDQELQRHLARRTTKTMPAVDREDVLAAVAGARARPPWAFRMRPRLLLAPVAAAVLVVLVGVPLLWTIAPGPGPSQSPSQSPSPSPSPGAVTIYTAQQLSDMIGDPAWVGHYVLGQAQLAYIRGATQCVARDPCLNAYMVGVPSRNFVSVDWRDAMQGEGVHLRSGEWVQPLSLPAAGSISAFKILDDSVDFLGPAMLASGGAPMTTAGAGSRLPPNAVDDVYVVSGWLTEPFAPLCPTGPPGGGDPSWYCDGSWLTPTAQPVKAFASPAAGLHTQNAAYAEFAADPNYDDSGPTSRFGTYLVRPAGTAGTLEGQSPVWRMVGRLDQAVSPAPSESIEPTPSPSSGAITIYTAQQLSDMIGDPAWVGHTVLAQAQLLVVRGYYTGPCTPPDPCAAAKLVGVSGPSIVTIGWRDTVEGQGTLYFADYGSQWLTPLTLPTDRGVFAFKVAADSVEYLGPARRLPDGSAFSPPDVPASAASAPADDVYVVSGWLAYSAPTHLNCPLPPDQLGSGDHPDMSWWCGGSWLNQDDERASGWAMGGLHAQLDAYQSFAPQPAYEPLGEAGGIAGVPEQGTYLVRPAGCNPDTMDGGCPVWRMVGRLDGPTTSPTPSPSPTPSTRNIDVLTQDQLVALSYDPSAKDRVVLADAQIDLAPVATADCAPFDPCYLGHIGDNPSVAVYEGWRDATSEGTGTFDTSQGRWLVRLGLPSADEHAMAFRIGHDTVEYLGDAQPSNGSFVWSVNDLLAQGAPAPDQVFAVDGWLVRTQQVPCPTSPPGAGGSHTDGNYECGGSFITPTAGAIAQAQNDLDPGGLHVQAGAYDAFAPNPTQIDVGLGPPAGTSDQAVYLVRFVGPRSTITSRRNVWRLVARLDPPMGATEATPTPSPTPAPSLPTSINGQAVLSTDDAQQQIDAGYSGNLLIAGQIAYVQADCYVPPDFPDTPLLAPCGDGFLLQGIDGSGTTIRLAPVTYDGPLPTDGPIVVRAHAYDPLAADCPANYLRACQLAVVVDGIAWPSAAPSPTFGYMHDELFVTFCDGPTQATINALESTYGLTFFDDVAIGGESNGTIFTITDGVDASIKESVVAADSSVCSVDLVWIGAAMASPS